MSFAKRGTENRERSRLDRTRLFGYARSLFLQCGRILTEKGLLDEARDVFYLTMAEAFGAGEKELKDTVSMRKAMYEAFASYPAYSRVVFAHTVMNKPPLHDGLGTFRFGADVLLGTPCSFGSAAGEALVIRSEADIRDVKGKILVTLSTDPGWIFLMVGAAGLISEKGSLLSHTAIVSRELGIPVIVGADGVTDRVKNGDMVKMDCSTGRISVDRRQGV